VGFLNGGGFIIRFMLLIRFEPKLYAFIILKNKFNSYCTSNLGDTNAY